MKKGLVVSVGVLALSLLAACGSTNNESSDDKVIKVASQTTPMTDVVKVAGRLDDRAGASQRQHSVQRVAEQ